MASAVPAMRGRLGNTEYYILSMKAKELTEKVTIPKEMEGWEDLSIEERYQRDINYNRVKKQIAPYLANDSSRFFGAVIVAAINFAGSESFEPLTDVATKGIPGLYRAAAENIGFITFRGGEIWVPLDGQHRLKAIEFAVRGRDENGRDIPNIKPCNELAEEDVTVILVAYEPKKARNIFTRVNRYAKPTTKGQNIVTDDDDVIAVLTRKVANDLIGGRLAKYTSNTLGPKDREFTTLAIVYGCNKAILESTFPGRIDQTQLPSRDKQQLYEEKVMEVWQTLLDGIEVFADVSSDKEESGDEKRIEIRSVNLLGKPVTQECLVSAFVRLTGPPTNMGADDACDKLNRLPWAMSEENLKIWQRVLWAGGKDGKIITKNRKLATRIIAYLAGERLTDEERPELLEDYRQKFPEEERPSLTLPEVI